MTFAGDGFDLMRMGFRLIGSVKSAQCHPFPVGCLCYFPRRVRGWLKPRVVGEKVDDAPRSSSVNLGLGQEPSTKKGQG